MSEPSGKALQISMILRAGIVVSKLGNLSLLTIQTISISKSVAVRDNMPFTDRNKTLPKIGNVCLLSTAPITNCKDLSNSSLLIIVFIYIVLTVVISN